MSVEVSGGTGDDCDALVAVFDQVLHDFASAAGVVDVDGVERSASKGAVEKHNGMAVGKICHQGFGVDVRRHDDHAVNSAPHCAHCAFDLAFVLVRVGDDEVVTGASCGEVDAANDFRKEFSIEVGEENSDCAGFAGD